MNQQQKVQELERRVSRLEERLDIALDEINTLKQMPSVRKLIKVKTSKPLSRVESRQYAINMLQQNNPHYLVMKASREEGSGIILKPKESGRTKVIKFYHSSSQYQDRFSGVFKLNRNVLNRDNVDSIIFNVYWSGEVYSFIFRIDEIGKLFYRKEHDKNGDYHINFEMKESDFVEVRGSKGNLDYSVVTEHYNNWNMGKPVYVYRGLSGGRD